MFSNVYNGLDAPYFEWNLKNTFAQVYVKSVDVSDAPRNNTQTNRFVILGSKFY